MLGSQTAHSHDLPRIFSWLQAQVAQLIVCDSVSIYVLQDDGVSLSTWLNKQQQQQQHADLSEQATEEALRHLFRNCASTAGDSVDSDALHVQATSTLASKGGVSRSEFDTLLRRLK